jgi:hypothetical protein
MGFRVAFAPFDLNELDESLYSFSDPMMPDERGQSLMQAAGVSARFPLIMPPFSAAIETKDDAAGTKTEASSDANSSATDSKALTNETSTTKRWNFVDGAYSDNSGATSALDIYKAIENVSPQYVDLRLILITSSIPQPDLKGSGINGTVFRDTVAPLDALMKVREDLGNDAVARACTYVYHDDPRTAGDTGSQPQGGSGKSGQTTRESNQYCVERAGGKRSPLHLVEIQDQTYGLSLGWKISKTSFDVVSWMLGKPDTCPGQDDQKTSVVAPHQKTVQASEDNVNAQLRNPNILERNSCVLKTLVDLVDGSLSTPVSISPANTAH